MQAESEDILESEDRNRHKGPVRIGIGPEEHHKVLTQALGCEMCYTVEQCDIMHAHDLPSPLRPQEDDVAVIIFPTRLSPALIKWLGSTKAWFEVPGHEKRRLLTWAERQEFRKLKATVEKQPVPDGRGADPTYDIPKSYHPTAVKLWHHGSMRDGKWVSTYTRKEIVQKIKQDTGVEVSVTWARDRAKEAVGHTARNPKGGK